MHEEQIIHGIWHHSGEFAPPSEPLLHIEKYLPVGKLGLSITQTPLAAANQRKLVDAWCQKLPELTEVKYLWLFSKVSQKIFDAACKMPNLEGLWIKWSGIKNLDSLTRLRNLKHLHLGSSSQVESIETLGSLTHLVTLEMEQLNKISDFSALANLIRLEGLGIDGGTWTAQNIDTLSPLARLKNLQYLSTTNSRIKDKSFEPILGLGKLKRFSCSWNYPESEFEKLKSMPNLKYGNVETSWKKVKESFRHKLK